MLQIRNETHADCEGDSVKLWVFGLGASDDTYNLVELLENENRSLWRIRNHYKNDAPADEGSRQLWVKIEREKQKIIRLLSEKVKTRL